MEVFRLGRKKHSDWLSGKGAALKGGRWNSPGVEIVYTATNRSLAMAEVAVHLTLATLPDDYMMVTIEVPDDVPVKKLEVKDLPAQWRKFPYPPSNAIIGDRFISENIFCAMRIPSAVTKGDYNLLLNPRHPDFKKIKVKQVEKFPFDRRIFK